MNNPTTDAKKKQLEAKRTQQRIADLLRQKMPGVLDHVTDELLFATYSKAAQLYLREWQKKGKQRK